MTDQAPKRFEDLPEETKAFLLALRPDEVKTLDDGIRLVRSISTVSAIMKAQIDWIPLPGGSIRPTQGRTLALMQVSGGSQSFNAVNQMRILGRWMRMITIPNQSSVAKAWQEFTPEGRMKPSSFYERVVDVMEELNRTGFAGDPNL